MRSFPLVAALTLAVVLSGCATPTSPVGDAEAGHSGKRCEAGEVVVGFGADGAPECDALRLASMRCGQGEVVTGFDATGRPDCRGIMEVAEEVVPPTPPTSRPAKSMSLSSAAAISNGVKHYTVTAATPGLTWSQLALTLDGVALTYDGDAPGGDDHEFWVEEGGKTTTGRTTPSTTIDAGDRVSIQHSSLSGKTLRLLDAEANAVILTITVG